MHILFSFCAILADGVETGSHTRLGDFQALGNGVYELSAPLEKSGWYLLRIQGSDQQGNQAVAMLLGKRP